MYLKKISTFSFHSALVEETMIYSVFGSIFISCFVLSLSDFVYDTKVCPKPDCVQKLNANEFSIFNATKITFLNPIKARIPKAEVIKIQKCNLMSLNKDELNFESLKILQVINNRLSILKEKTLSHLTRLEEIDLSYNQVHSISGNFFSGIIDLKFINLKNNSIGELPKNLFTNLTKLQHVDLSCNELILIDNGTFDYNTDLIYLNLKNNQLKIFKFSQPVLHYLDLSNNQLQNLEMKNVNYLYVNHCLLKSLTITGYCYVIEAHSNELEYILIKNKRYMISMDIADNDLQNIRDLLSINTLQSLDLSKNVLSHEYFETIRLKSLKYLNIQGFFIDSVDMREILSELDYLETLIVSTSNTELEIVEMFPSLKNLKTLIVYGENLSSLSKTDNLKSIFPDLKRLTIKEHKLNFNQRVILKKQLIKLNIEFTDLHNEEQQNLQYNGIFDQIDSLTELTETSNNSNKYLLITILLILICILLMNALTILNFNIYTCTGERFTNIDHSFHDSTVSFLYNDESRI